jgi:hypothetical protein
VKLPIQARPLIRGVSSSKLTGNTVIPSECDWECSEKVLECASDCYEGDVEDGLACLGPSYEACIDCFDDLDIS